ncbi:DUF6777 domain-containing protein [Streptomyces sp. NBC_00691]|uniref:DUF6777 domain-containing protein n=1 Tax=Streptomyces sp. NBC_00691 TaxID=2903671 RepID=UPI002E30B492|nr:DUF6777 domain-containing protein [Streptomyces sp. NBC_00691]
MRSPLCRTRRTPAAPGATHPTAPGPTAPGPTASRATPAAEPRAPHPGPPRATPRAALVRSALAALTASLLLAGCTSVWEGSRGGAQPAAAGPTQDILLQPLAAQGPDPFTESSARATGRLSSPVRGPDTGAEQVREVTGSTPGLYGGTRAEGSCDVERQVSFVTADADRTRAFADAAGIPEANVPDWLRELTPVVLRSDTRVTSHGYREGKANAFQSVLQTGTAVLVDQYGSPRVRCACGNPLRTPSAVRDGIHQGEPWDGFDPDRVIVVRPTTTVVTSLVIVNNADRSWIERATGSDGAEDRRPAVEPACDPDACALADGAPDPTGPDGATPDPSAPDRRTSPDPASPPAPVPPAPENPLPDASGTGGTGTDPGPVDPYQDPRLDPRTQPDPADPYAEPPGEQPVPDGELPPEELFPVEPVPDQPETFEG